MCDGPRCVGRSLCSFRVPGSSAAARHYAGVIQNYLKNVGVPVTIETSEFTTDARPVALAVSSDDLWTMGRRQSGSDLSSRLVRDLRVPPRRGGTQSEPLYNPELDKILNDAANTYDHAGSRALIRQGRGDYQSRCAGVSAVLSGEYGDRQKTVGNIHCSTPAVMGLRKRTDRFESDRRQASCLRYTGILPAFCSRSIAGKHSRQSGSFCSS